MKNSGLGDSAFGCADFKLPEISRRGFLMTTALGVLSSTVVEAQPSGGDAAAPQVVVDPTTPVGGFALTLATCNDTTSEFIPLQCTLTAPAVGLVQITATGADNSIEIPLAAMVSSAGYHFDLETYKMLRLRLQAGDDVTGGFTMEWIAQDGEKSASGSVTVPHVAGKWAVQVLDFSVVPA